MISFMYLKVPDEDIRPLTVMDGFHSLCNKGTFLRQTFLSEMANIRSFKGLGPMYIQAFKAWQHLWDLKTRLEI